MPLMNIRRVLESDYKELMGLYNAFVGSERYANFDNDSFKRVLHSPRNFVYVAEDEGKLVGFASFSVRDVVRYPRPIAELDELFVGVAWRKHGVGRELMAAVEAKARELDCYRMFIESQYQHTSGHKFYESLGYTNYGYHFVKNL
jgi:(aminoalkyl)phosphonate N-acetyltransferase